MAKITLETGDRVTFDVSPGYSGYGILISDTEMLMVVCGARSGPRMKIAPIPDNLYLLKDTADFTARVAMDAAEIMLKHTANKETP